MRALPVLILACATPAKQPEVAEPPALDPPNPVLPATPPAVPAARIVDATPDVPSGAAAARDVELAKLAAAYVEAFTNSSPELTLDGKRVVFVSNRDGLPQLYIADVTKAAAPATRLLETKERVALATVTRDGKAVLFRSDKGADENWSIFRVGLDGKGLVELTPGEPSSRSEPIVVGDTMYFSGVKATDSRTSMYSAPATTPGAAKAHYTSERPANLMDVDANGATALITEFPDYTDMSLLRLDLASGKTQKLYPTDGKVTIFEARFSPDGKRAYVATDGGGEPNVVLALDTKTGKHLAKYAATPASAEIIGLSVAPKGGLVALTLSVGHQNQILLLDAKKLTPVKQRIKLPLGQGNARRFSSDGKRLAAVWSTPSSPLDVLAINTATGVSAPLRVEARPTLAKLPKIDVSIASVPAFDGGKIPVNVLVPDGEHDKPHPVIVSFHGGPMAVSTIRWSAQIAFWLSLGYVVVEPNVRGSGGFGRAYEAADNGRRRVDALKDVEASARWVAQQPWADKNRMIVYGGSYGGYTALIALSRWPELWRAGVNMFGISNLKTFMQTTTGVMRKIFAAEFGDPDKDGDFLVQMSPLTDVDKIVDPIFVYAGANDPRVPRAESDQIVKALRLKGIPTEYVVAPNEGHSLARNENLVQFLARCARFLETHAR